MKKLLPLFTFIIFFLQNNTAQNIERGPYLQSGGTSSIIVKWRTNTETDSKVWYGNSPTNLNQFILTPDSVEDHEVSITGLAPNTKYYYAVGSSEEVLAGGDSEHFFNTAPPIGTDQFVRAWVLGDCGSGGSGAEEVRDAYYEYVGEADTDFILLLGDNAYSSGEDDEYQSAIFNMYDEIINQTTMWSCPGNHDYYSADAENQSGPYYDIFTFPKNGELGGFSSGTESYYSFDYANIHFISLDSDDTDKGEGDPMLVWLETDLNSTNQDWIVALFHHPPYSKGSHDSDDDSGHHVEMRENVLPILEAGGVDLVLSGHSHSYERSYLLNGHYGYSSSLDSTMILDSGDGQIMSSGAYSKSDVGPDQGKGAVYVVAGSAAKTSSGPLDHPVMYYSVRELGSLSLEVLGNQLDLKFINEHAEVEDYFTIIKTGLSGGTTPVVWMTSPLANQAFEINDNITLAANATDPDGNITKVEFFINNTYLHTDYNSPFSFDWSTLETGPYSISAKATDNDGNVGISPTVSITVNNSNPGISTFNCPTDISETCPGANGYPISWEAPTFITGCTPTSTDCQDLEIDDATFLGIWDGHYYFQTDDKMRWEDAVEFCNENGGYLAVIDSQEENDTIQAMIEDDSWIGYSDIETEGQFEWINNSSSTFENWDEYQPSEFGNSQDFVMIKEDNGAWHDKPNYKISAVMEIPCPEVPIDTGNLVIEQVAGLASGSLFPEGTTTISYKATDACGNVETCSFDVIIFPCPCELENTIVQNVQCFDSGTPEDGSDDTYTFDLQVNGSFTGASWSGADITGNYNILQNKGPFLSNGATSRSWTIADQNDPQCTISFTVNIPNCITIPEPPCTPENIEGFSWLAESENTMFYLSDEKSMWEDAEANCLVAGGHLASIHSQEENDLLVDALSDYNNYVYIGISDHEEEDNFVWSDGTDLTFNNIDDDFNNNSFRNYGLLNPWAGTWSFVNEGVTKKYILEIPCGQTVALQAPHSPSTIKESAVHLRANNEADKVNQNIELFPNPVRSQLNVRLVLDADKTDVAFTIVKIDGIVLLEEKRNLDSGMQGVAFDTSELASGIYFLQVLMEAEVVDFRFVKI